MSFRSGRGCEVGAVIAYLLKLVEELRKRATSAGKG